MKQALVMGAAAALRTYYNHVPLTAGKRAVWHRVVRRLARHDVPLIATTWFGARMNARLSDTIQRYLYFFGVWEPAITAYAATMLRPGDTVIDVGANIGYDTLLAAHCVGPAGRVFAIEASPSVHALLRCNLALNHVPQVTSYQMAVCAAACRVPVYLHDPSNLGGTTIVPSVARDRSTTLEAMVDGKPLAEIVPRDALLNARLIKIDVEGAEWPVVRGLIPYLAHLSPRTEILVEVNAAALRDHGTTAAEFLRVFETAGFRAFSLPNVYSVDSYLKPASATLEPLTGSEFEQLDIVFRR